MITRPFLTLLLGAFLVPVSMERPGQSVFSPAPLPNSFLEQRNDLALSSAAFVVANPRTGEVLSERNANRVMPIASITKLMTALVVLDANQRLSEMLTVTMADVDRLKGTGSRLAVGSRLSRADMLHIALMSSENRAASALARNYPGGQRAFIEAMNAKARMLGMWSTQFSDSTGLTPRNVSSAHDLAKLVAAASTYPLIRQYSSTEERMVRNGKRQLHYLNSNRLVREGSWPISLSRPAISARRSLPGDGHPDQPRAGDHGAAQCRYPQRPGGRCQADQILAGELRSHEPDRPVHSPDQAVQQPVTLPAIIVKKPRT